MLYYYLYWHYLCPLIEWGYQMGTHKENKIDDVIFENNMSIIGSTEVASKFDQMARAGE